MKIYTKTGDAGQTGLFGGARVSKADPRVDSYGAVDELNSCIGIARAQPGPVADLDGLLANIQSALFDLGAELATNPDSEKVSGLPQIGTSEISELEGAIDRFETELPALKTFILPGGTPFAAHLHLARTVCRRAERRVVALSDSSPVRDELGVYLNRLSDLLFVLARVANHRAGVEDVPWVGRGR